MPEPETRTRRLKNRHGGAPRGAASRSQGTSGRLASARRAASCARPPVPRKHRAPSRRSIHPSFGGGCKEWAQPGRNASRERKVLFEMTAERTMRLTPRMSARSRHLRGVGRVRLPALTLRFETRHLQKLAEQSQPVLARHGGEIGGHRGHVIGYGAPVDDLLAVRWVGHSEKHAPFCPATTPPSFAASENRKRPSMARGGCVLKGPCRANFNPPRKRNRDRPGSPWFDTEG